MKMADVVCPVCDREIKSNQHALECSVCVSWIHKGCSGISRTDFNKMCPTSKKNGNLN